MIAIRPAVPEDEVPLRKWFAEPGVLRWFPMLDEREVDDAVRNLMAYVKMGSALTALFDGEICGMAFLYPQPYKKLAHQSLFTIIVDQNHRGKGIGTKLLQELIVLGKEKFHIEILHLEVYEGNPAKNLYSRLGFVEFGRHAHFIKENDEYIAKIFMQKTL